MHPEVQFFYNATTAARQSATVVSNNLKGIEKSRNMTTIYKQLAEFVNSEESLAVPPVAYEERFPPSGLPLNPTHEDAFALFEKTQTAKSVNPIYTMLMRANNVTVPRSKTANMEWYLTLFKPLFMRDAPVSTLRLWNAFSNFQFDGSAGIGYKYAEFKRKHFIGLMQSLDLLASAREEPPVPKEVDFAGNRLVTATTGSSTPQQALPIQEVTNDNEEVCNFLNS
jgi:hypothetical protein